MSSNCDPCRTPPPAGIPQLEWSRAGAIRPKVGYEQLDAPAGRRTKYLQKRLESEYISTRPVGGGICDQANHLAEGGPNLSTVYVIDPATGTETRLFGLTTDCPLCCDADDPDFSMSVTPTVKTLECGFSDIYIPPEGGAITWTCSSYQKTTLSQINTLAVQHNAALSLINSHPLDTWTNNGEQEALVAARIFYEPELPITTLLENLQLTRGRVRVVCSPPPASCYLKVWLEKVVQQVAADGFGDVGEPTVEEEYVLEWEGTGNPCFEDEGNVFDPFTYENQAITDPLGPFEPPFAPGSDGSIPSGAGNQRVFIRIAK